MRFLPVSPRATRSPLLAAAFLLAAAVQVFAASASGYRVNLDVSTPASIDATPITDRWSGYGFMPMRIRIENRSRDELAWNFSFEVNRGWGGSQLTYETALATEPGSVSETVVMIPGPAGFSVGSRTHISLRLDGPGANGYGGGFLNNNGESVIPTATTTDVESRLFSAVHGAPGTKTEITAVEPKLWPADWRVWSPFSRVVLEEAGYAALDGARRAALHDWVAMGGTLDIYPERSGSSGSVRRHGLGIIRRTGRTLAQEGDASPKPEVRIERLALENFREASSVIVSPARQESLELRRGVLGVSIFLAVFGLVIGPVNLFWFAPSGRRQRLFFTLPAISLGASLLMAGYIVVEDGFGGEGAVHGLVLLVPDNNQAVVTQRQFSRTGVLLGTGFDMPSDVVLAHTGGTGFSGDGDYSYSRENRADHYSRTDVGAAGDWFASRRRQEQELSRLVPTRARVELVGGGSGEAPVVQSSVGAVLTGFRYMDSDGVTWEAPELAPGQRVTLRRAAVQAVEPGWRRGTFTAAGGGAEGLAPIPTLESIRWDAPKFLYAGPVAGARTQ